MAYEKAQLFPDIKIGVPGNVSVASSILPLFGTYSIFEYLHQSFAFWAK